MTSPLSPDQQTASGIIQAQLTAWGLASLTGKVSDLIRQGLNSDAITMQLQSTAEYKQRFAANEARQKAGLAALTPAQYIATENSYRQVLQQYGLPSTFYDSQDDYRQFLEKDVSPDEVKQRASVAQQVWLSTDDSTKTAWRDFYGLSDGAAIANILDSNRALPIIQHMAATAQAGGSALSNGLQADQGRLGQYVDQGVSQSQIAQGFSQIGQTHATDQALATRYGTTFGQADEEAARIQNLAPALKRQQEMYASEQSLFGGRSGGDENTLNRRTGGSF